MLKRSLWKWCAAVGLVASALGCSSKSENRFIATRATQVHVGNVEADIPAGWRDINELVKKLPMELPPGSRTIVAEAKDERAIVMLVPVPFPVQGQACEEIGKLWEAQGGVNTVIDKVQPATFSGQPGCLMNTRIGGKIGKISILTPTGGSTVAVICQGRGTAADYGCEKIVYGVRATKPPA